MTSIYDVLKASKGIHVDDTFAELWGRKLSNAYIVATYTGTLPTTLQTVEGYLESYKIYGNTEQNGTPTPENPIVPSGCGVRTENLCKISADNSISYSTYTKYSIADDTVYTTGNTLVAFICKVAPNTQYTVSTTATMESSLRIREYSDFPDNWESGFVTQSLSVACSINSPTSGTIITNANTQYIGVTLFTINSGRFTDIMLNEGSTALPYEPYGYKLPILSNSTVTNIYLGEVQTTRRIKKLVLTGEETINGMTDANDGAKAVSYTYSSLGMTDTINNERSMDAIPYPIYLSSHFKEKTSGYSSWFNINTGEIGANNAIPYAINRYLIFGTSEQTQADFKSYLAAQYAAGTPVTVWYVLAEPETAVVNEPLMKIGDYADTIDSTQTTVQIPTAAGETTISWAGEGLAPSEVELTYRKPKGQ